MWQRQYRTSVKIYFHCDYLRKTRNKNWQWKNINREKEGHISRVSGNIKQE